LRKAKRRGGKLGRRSVILWGLSILVGLGAAAVAVGLEHFLQQTRNYYLLNQQGNAYDQGMSRYALARAAGDAALPVVVCAIQEQTREQFDRYPVSGLLPSSRAALRYRFGSRAYHARVLRNLRRLGARVVVFDMLFDEEDPATDGEFARAIRERRDVVLAAVDIQRVLKGGLAEQTVHIHHPTWALRQAAAAIGAVNVKLDTDRSVRRFRWVFTSWDEETLEDRPLPALGVAAAALYLGEDPTRALTDEFLPRGTLGGKRAWWMVERSGTETSRVSYIRYFGPVGFPAGAGSMLPYEEAFAAFDPITSPADRERLRRQVRGKIVLVGDETDLAQDWHRVPVISPANHLDYSQQMPGVEIQAAITQTVLSGHYVQQGPRWARILLILGVCLVTALLGRILTPWPFIALSALTLAGLVGGSIWLLAHASFWMEPVTAGVGLIAAFSGETTLMFFGERKGRLQVSRQLSRHVGPGVAETLTEDEWPELSGETREITMLFSDLQGFTSLSENMNSEEICDLLNRYFAVVFPVVFKYGGVMDKLMGDGMMAYFGWPQQEPDHAARAVRCAVEIQGALAAWQRTPEMAGRPPLRTRVGIHTGPATIGEIGFGDRAEFTVIGDVVNTASRLEGMNKEYGTAIMISGVTREAAGEIAPTVYRGVATVRGRKEPVPVYSVEVGEPAAVPAEPSKASAA
jgi:adenylate cyclase